MACFGDCFDLGPPPDMIMSMPPPPLPSFLLPRSAIVALSGNDSQPCFAPYMCEPSPGPREQSGIEFIELSRKGQLGTEDTWLLVLVSSCVGVLLLGALLAMILMKCRESYNYTYQEAPLKQPPMSSLAEAHHLGSSKPHSFMAGTMLYPCVPPNNNTYIQQQLANDNRVLWAALTPHGTQHFVSESYPNQEDHYEVIDYDVKDEPKYTATNYKSTPIKSSFENNGFVDYDYEDPTPLIESYHLDDMDSGYQESQEVIGTLTRPRSPRPIVSSPTRIEHPNIPPLNLYPHRNNNNGAVNSNTNTLLSSNVNGATLNKKSTLNRRISDTSTYSGQNI